MADGDFNVLRNTLDLVLLKALTWGPRHGYAVSEWIERATDAELFLEEGTLYPALHRLERKGWIESAWGVSDNNRKAKYYTLTRAGRAQLRGEMPAWERYVDAVGKALRSTSPETA